VPQLDSAKPHLSDSHRAVGRPAPLGRAAGVEDLEVVAGLVKRQVRVAEQHGIGIREASAHPLQSPLRRSGVVKEPEGHPVQLQGELLGKLTLQFRAIDVAVDRRDWTEALQLGEDLSLAEVTEVDDQI